MKRLVMTVMLMMLAPTPMFAQSMEETLSFILFRDKVAYQDPTAAKCKYAPQPCQATFSIIDRASCTVEVTFKQDAFVPSRRVREFAESKEVYKFALVSPRLIKTELSKATGYTNVELEGDEPFYYVEANAYIYATDPNGRYQKCLAVGNPTWVPPPMPEQKCTTENRVDGGWSRRATFRFADPNTARRVADALAHLYREHCPSVKSAF